MDPGRPLAGKAVLVVEDSTVQRNHVVSVIWGLGADRVLEAKDGMDAMAQLTHAPGVDLVVTDLDMPRMDGVCFIGELAARGLRPEVVILSAQEPGVLNAVHLMAETWGLRVAVLAKPVSSPQLLRLLVRPRPAPAGRGELTEKASPADIADGLRAGEFLCHFQPQVTLHRALLKGVEALARWARPGRGLQGPGAFLPQIEGSPELMREFTFAILGDAAGSWHSWRRKGLNLELSVNLSARSISCQGFADQLMAEVERLEVPPRSLVFELTESASVSNLGNTLANLARLRMRGFKLSIDDFGTGWTKRCARRGILPNRSCWHSVSA